MTQFTLRQATPQDADSVGILFDAYRQFYDQPADEEAARTYIRDRLKNAESTILIAENTEGSALGFCQLYFSFCSVAMGRLCVLYDLFVIPTSRRVGVAHALISAAEEFAAARGAIRITLQTESNNHKAQSVYESLDWKRDKRFRHFSKNLLANG